MLEAQLHRLNRRGKNLAARIVYWTGKAPRPIHPKHLCARDDEWFLRYAVRQRVVDIGCGHGTHTLAAARVATSVVGLDLSPRWPPFPPGHVTFAVHDCTRTLPLESGSVGLVLCLDMIEHVDDRQALLREIARVLVPTGVLCITAPNRDTAWRRRLRSVGLDARHDDDHRLEYTLPEFLAELRAAGFFPRTPPEIIVYDTPWAGLLDVVGAISLWSYERIVRWKRRAVQRSPQNTTGWRVVAQRSTR